MSDAHLSRSERRAAQLLPHAPPRVLDDVYSQEQLAMMFDVARRSQPLPLLVRKAFKSVEEIQSATSGSNNMGSLKDYLAPMFSGDLAFYSACLDCRLTDTFYNRKLMDLVSEYWGTPIVLPRQLRFNVAAPMKSSDPGHFDSPQYRGISYTNTPVWLIKLMANSMLFEKYQIKLGSVVTWCWTGSEHGGFTYWPDGAEGQPRRITSPMWNRGCVAENEGMFHRGESIGSADQWGLDDLTFDSVFIGDPASPHHWLVKDGDRVIARYATEDLRWMFHWTAMVFEDREALQVYADHTNDLNHAIIFDTLIKDLKSDGVDIELPANPLNDAQFRQLLIAYYAIGSPKLYPPEAPVAPLAA